MKVMEWLDATAGGADAAPTLEVNFGETTLGAFGGVFGGAVAIALLQVARLAAPGRRPVALDCRFLRGLKPGCSLAAATIERSGRVLTSVTATIEGPAGGVVAAGAVQLVDDPHLQAWDETAGGGTGFAWHPYEDATVMAFPDEAMPPLMALFAPRFSDFGDGWKGTLVHVPFDDPDCGPEAACIGGDMAVGPPVMAALAGRFVPFPNPDLSLRFTSQTSVAEVAGLGRLEAIAGGIATNRVECRSPEGLLAIGHSYSTLLHDR